MPDGNVMKNEFFFRLRLISRCVIDSSRITICFVRFHEVNLVDIGILRNIGGISFSGWTAFPPRSYQPSVHLCGSRLMPKIQYHHDHWRLKGGGGARDLPPSLFLFQFHAIFGENGQNNRYLHPSLG